MINLGSLQEVPGHTFIYSGYLTLGDKKYWVGAFETNSKDGHKSFTIRCAEDDYDKAIILNSMSEAKREVVKKKVEHVAVDDSHLVPSKSTDSQPSLF